MGRNFNALVELVNKHIKPSETSPFRNSNLPPARDYLDSLIRKTALFDFPLNGEDIQPNTGMEDPEYIEYLKDYFDMSAQHGSFLITPFPVTAIEDNDSVVILDNIAENHYYLTQCRIDQTAVGELVTVMVGDIFLSRPGERGGFQNRISNEYTAQLLNGQRVPLHTERAVLTNPRVSNDTNTATIAYVEQLAYIMDPDNFIIEKESNQGRKYAGKKSAGKKLRKTVMRPHYVCLSEADTREFLQDQSKHPRSAHPVRGHWRRLMSPRYVNMQGQRVFIQQYFTGQGQVEGQKGWHYQVMIKEGPNKLTPYKG